jgi:hypothetical protein
MPDSGEAGRSREINVADLEKFYVVMKGNAVEE